MSYNAGMFSNSASWAQIPNKIVGWKGSYSQGGAKQDMRFNNLQVNIGGGLFGSGSDNVGQFTLSGQVAPNGDVKFVKQYHGQHSVNYAGKMNGGVIEGKWDFQGAGDAFRIEMDAQEVWEGFYEQGGQKQNMKFNLSLDQNGVFGAGNDNVGNFVIRGQQQGNQVHFSKAYYGKHTVNYSGQLTKEGNNRVIRGYWNASGAHGQFELRSTVVGGGHQGGFPSFPGQPGMPSF